MKKNSIKAFLMRVKTIWIKIKKRKFFRNLIIDLIWKNNRKYVIPS